MNFCDLDAVFFCEILQLCLQSTLCRNPEVKGMKAAMPFIDALEKLK